jgi:hypothetical protein
MKLYFIPASVPELAALPRQQRDRVWRVASRLALKKERSVWAGAVLCGLLCAIGSAIGSHLSSRYIGLAAGAFAGSFIFHAILIRASIPYVRASLKTE